MLPLTVKIVWPTLLAERVETSDAAPLGAAAEEEATRNSTRTSAPCHRSTEGFIAAPPEKYAQALARAKPSGFYLRTHLASSSLFSTLRFVPLASAAYTHAFRNCWGRLCHTAVRDTGAGRPRRGTANGGPAQWGGSLLLWPHLGARGRRCGADALP